MRALKHEGYTIPTPIQAKAIPPILEGRDVLGCAQTGTGKTAAFALPILHRLSSAPVDKSRRGPTLPRALILSPTRELATQIAESFGTYGKQTHISGTVVYGGVSQFHQVKALQRGIDVLVATPGRLMDLMEQGFVNLSQISIFVLDEADRMLDMGFINPIRKIAGNLPKNRQTLLFSATMPKEIMHLADSLLRNPVKVTVTPVASAAPLIEQKVYFVPRPKKQAMLEHLLKDPAPSRVLVFTKTKHGADRVARNLNRGGFLTESIHGNKAQNQRQRALEGFRAGRSRVLVATDVAARGLDVDGITHVINYDLPMEPEAYVHRIGRTGRAGATGIAISFCDSEERDLLRAIERLTGKRVPTAGDLPELTYNPLHHEPREMERSSQGSRGPRGGGGGGHRGGGGGGGPRGGYAGSNSRGPARSGATQGSSAHQGTGAGGPSRSAGGAAPQHAGGGGGAGPRQWNKPTGGGGGRGRR
ncbi:MAG: DEAD/DEAH box helicase [Phycisphaerales bacterium]